MVRVPLPQESLQGGSIGGFRAFRTVPQRSAAGAQITQLGRAAQAAGTATASIADILQDDLDVATAKEAFALWNDENRVTLHDPDSGYLNKQGKAATGQARVTTQDQIAKNAGNFSKNLDNDTQRSLFGTAVGARTSQINQQLDVHEARAVHVFGIGEAKAMSEEAASNAVDEATLPAPNLLNFEKQKSLSVREATKTAEMLGYGPAQTEALVLDTTTAIHVGVIDRLLKQGNPDTAQEYFQGVDKEEITSKARTRLQGVVQTATMNDRAHDLSVAIVDEVDVQSDKIIAEQETAQIEGRMDPNVKPVRLDADDRLVEARRNLAARDMPDAMRRATRQRIEQAFADRAAEEATAMADVVTRSQEFLKENPRMGPTNLPDADQAELVRTGRWAAMNRFADTGRFGSDPRAFAAFLGLSREELQVIKSPEQLELDMADLGMSRADRQIIRSGWQRAHAGGAGGGGAAPDRALTIHDRITATAKLHTLMPKSGSMSDKNAGVFEIIREIVNNRIREAEEGPGGRPFGDDLQKIIDDTFREELVTTSGQGLFAFERFAARDQLTQEQLQGSPTQPGGSPVEFQERGGVNPAFRDFTLRDLAGTEVRLTVPVNDHLISRLRANGVEVTDKEINELWIALGKPETLAEAISQ